jgi:N,N'-diacetyllegionaminate synthase
MISQTSNITLGSRVIGPGEAVYIIAELACAHEGDLAFAEKTITAAAGAGADAVKFQVFSADGLVVPTHPLYANYVRFQFTLDQWRNLADLARQAGLQVMVDVFEPWSLVVARQIGAVALKVHSTSVTNPFFLADVAAAAIPVIIGTGGTTRNEIDQAVDVLSTHDTPLAMVHGFQGYPTTAADTNLRRMVALCKDFDMPVGFASHEAGRGPGQLRQNLLAVGLGASFLENHITCDPSPERTDYASSLLPGAFAEMITAIREAEVALGVESYELGEKEMIYRKSFKAFTVAATDLPAGHELRREDLAFKRADAGMLPLEANDIIGRRLSQAVDKDQPIMRELLA